MARPKPTIILDQVDKSYNSEQILKAEAICTIEVSGEIIKSSSLIKAANSRIFFVS